jgi:5,10-methylenetetrahydromethanopterin reductase
MDYGFAFLSAVDIHKDVVLAERKGFTHAWLYDTQMICADVFQCLALCAAKTKKIKLGTNVTNPLSRIAPVTANNFATLNLLGQAHTWNACGETRARGFMSRTARRADGAL